MSVEKLRHRLLIGDPADGCGRNVADRLGPLRAVVTHVQGQPGETVYVIEVNPRASRTVPYVSKATGVPLAKIAAKLMVGASRE